MSHIITQENNIQVLNAPLIQKLKQHFTEIQQELFITSFSMYLQHNKEEFIIDLDNVYSWIGFSLKGDCKKLLLKHFEENKDYIVKISNEVLLRQSPKRFLQRKMVVKIKK